MDFIVHLRRTFYNKEGDEIFSQRAVCRRKCMSPSFYFELITLLPLPELFWGTELHLYLRLLVILRTHKLVRWVRTLNLAVRVKNIFKVFTYIILLLSLTLTFAGLWILLIADECVWLPLHQQLPDSKNPFCTGPSQVKQFLLSIVYTNIMIISEGQAFPQTEMQLVLGASFLLIGSFIDAILFGVVVNSVQEANAKQVMLNEEFDSLLQTVRGLRFQRSQYRALRHQLYAITLASFQHKEFENFLKNLTPSLRQRVVYDLFSQKFSHCIFLKNKSSLQNVANNITLTLYIPEDVIFEYGSPSDGIYFLLRGQIDLLSPRIKNDKEMKIVKTLKPGSYFGEIGAFLNTTRSLRAQSSQIYSTLAFLPTASVNTSIWSNHRLAKSVEQIILRYNDRFCAWVGKVLNQAQLWDDPRSQIELYKFRIKQYAEYQYLWKPGEMSEGVMVVLSGSITFQIYTGGVMVPMGYAHQRSIIAFDHSFVKQPHQCYAHAETRVKVALYPLEQLQKLLERGSFQENWILRERKNIRRSELKPYPIDLVTTNWDRKRKRLFLFKNCVIRVIRALRRDKHQGFLEKLKKNIKWQNMAKNRLKRHRDFIRHSLKHHNFVQLGGRNKIRTTLMDCSDFLESQYYLRHKLSKVFTILASKSEKIREMDRTIITGIVSIAADNYLQSMHTSSSSYLSIDLEDQEEVKDLQLPRRMLKRTTQMSTFNFSEALPASESFISEGVEGFDSSFKINSFQTKRFTKFKSSDMRIQTIRKIRHIDTSIMSQYEESPSNS